MLFENKSTSGWLHAGVTSHGWSFPYNILTACCSLLLLHKGVKVMVRIWWYGLRTPLIFTYNILEGEIELPRVLQDHVLALFPLRILVLQINTKSFYMLDTCMDKHNGHLIYRSFQTWFRNRSLDCVLYLLKQTWCLDCVRSFLSHKNNKKTLIGVGTQRPVCLKRRIFYTQILSSEGACYRIIHY